MAIIRWRDPFGMMYRWPRMLAWDEDDYWTDEKEGLTVYETDNDVVVQANVAGVPPEKVDVSLEGGALTIRATHEETEEEKGRKKVVYKQARKAQYVYSTSIPCPIKADQVTAEVKDGVVTVTLPKEEKAKPKKIKVKAQASKA